ncbi:acyltransferase [Franconibacter helveticus]|uniref:acyltransferase n=1 Tax=Franconibacter helveticus TaxID=357240 RepID=UPI00066BBB50
MTMPETPTRRSVGVKNVTVGRDVVIYEPANLYGCELGDGVFIGPFVEIQSHTRIGRGTRVQSHTFICESVTIGERCFIGHGVMFANDMFREGKPNPDRESWGKIVIGDEVSIGSGATILAVSVCGGAVIGAGSVVTKSISEKGVYAGNPARLLRRL